MQLSPWHPTHRRTHEGGALPHDGRGKFIWCRWAQVGNSYWWGCQKIEHSEAMFKVGSSRKTYNPKEFILWVYLYLQHTCHNGLKQVETTTLDSPSPSSEIIFHMVLWFWVLACHLDLYRNIAPWPLAMDKYSSIYIYIYICIVFFHSLHLFCVCFL